MRLDRDRDKDKDEEREIDSTESWICASCVQSEQCGGIHLLHKHVKSWRSKERGAGFFMSGIINSFDKLSGVDAVIYHVVLQRNTLKTHWFVRHLFQWIC